LNFSINELYTCRIFIKIVLKIIWKEICKLNFLSGIEALKIIHVFEVCHFLKQVGWIHCNCIIYFFQSTIGKVFLFVKGKNWRSTLLNVEAYFYTTLLNFLWITCSCISTYHYYCSTNNSSDTRAKCYVRKQSKKLPCHSK